MWANNGRFTPTELLPPLRPITLIVNWQYDSDEKKTDLENLNPPSVSFFQKLALRSSSQNLFFMIEVHAKVCIPMISVNVRIK